MAISKNNVTLDGQVYALEGRDRVAAKAALHNSNAGAHFKGESKSEYAGSDLIIGVQGIGSLQNRWTVYKSPYMTENTLLVGFRGSNFLETGAVYAPYVPLIMTPLVYDPEDFTPRKGVMTRYAKKMIRPEFYGKIHVADLDLI